MRAGAKGVVYEISAMLLQVETMGSFALDDGSILIERHLPGEVRAGLLQLFRQVAAGHQHAAIRMHKPAALVTAADKSVFHSVPHGVGGEQGAAESIVSPVFKYNV